MKYFLILLLSITFSSTILSQSLIDLGDKNPKIKGVARIRTAIMDGEKLYLGGNLNFVNNDITPPITRLNADGSLDNNFIYNGNYSVNFEDNLTGPSTVLNGSLYVNGEDGIIKINNDGSIDESFKITGVNFVNSMVTYRDSLLVIGEAALMQLYSEDGNFRTIQTELSNDYYLLEIIKLSSDKVLIRIQDKASGVFSYTLFENELVKDDAFIPFIVNQPGNIKNIQSLPTGEIFVAGGDIMVNETAGNGIFTINDLGALSANSIHGSDLSFIDVYGNGIESAIPIDGKIIIEIIT